MARNGSNSLSVSAPTSLEMGGDGAIYFPSADFLYSASFVRSGSDLKLVDHDGHTVIIPRYFELGTPPPLIAPNNTVLDGDTVRLLAGPAHPGQYAQAGDAAAAARSPIGKVVQADGTISVQHADGTAGTLHLGDSIFENDVVETQQSSVGIRFADGSLFSMSAGTRMAINHFVYDANSSSNSALFSVVKGTFTMFGGKVVDSGNMEVSTPIATLGIRGSNSIGVNVDAPKGWLTTNATDPNGDLSKVEVLDPITKQALATLTDLFSKVVITPAGVQIVATTPQEIADAEKLAQILQHIYGIRPPSAPHFDEPTPKKIFFDFEDHDFNALVPGGVLFIPYQALPALHEELRNGFLQQEALAPTPSAVDTIADAPTLSVQNVTVDAVADAPTLSVQNATGNEDTAIALNITSALNDTDSSETLKVEIGGIPIGATLSAGTNTFTATEGLTTVNVTAWDLAQLTITPPLNSDADFGLTVTATSTETNGGATATTTGTINVTVDAVADAPTLSVQNATGNEDTAIALNITSVLKDTDGSETLKVEIGGIPIGATLSAGTNTFTATEGLTTVNVTAWDLAQLTITPPLNSDADFGLTVTATSTETNGGATATTTGTINVTVDAVADAPTLSVQNATGNEDTAIALNITSVLKDTDGSETLKVEIGGIPIGATLSAGDNTFTATEGLTTVNVTAWDLAQLTITPPLNSDADFGLTVTATSTETNGGATATTTGTINVTVDAVADAPTLSVQNATGNEDTAIALNITSALNDTDSSETLKVEIGGIPIGATLSAGDNTFTATEGLTTVNVTAWDLAQLTITPPLNSDADFGLTVTATSTETNGGATATTTGTINVTVDAVADAPTLSVQNATGNEDTAIALNITSALNDTDGSETLKVEIGGIPIGATLSAGTNTFTATEGLTTVNVTAWDLAQLTITPPLNSDADFGLTVTATSTETNGGATATTTGTINVTVDAVADAPTLSVQNATGNEDTAIALNITSVLKDTDGSETLKVEIGGIPIGATLSAGTNTFTATEGLTTVNVTAWDLAQLTITPPLNSDADFGLTVTATSTETNGGATATTTGTINVTVDAVADAPTLSVQNATGNEDTAIALNITSVLNDTDGSETLKVEIGGIPIGATLSAGTNTFTATEGLTTVNVTAWDLAQLTITPPLNSDADFGLTVTATSTETNGGATATTTGTINVTVDAVADAPTLSVQNATGNEDTAIALNITSALKDTDSSETLKVEIGGIPIGATLSAGTNTFTATEGLTTVNVTAWDLAQLTITPPLNSDADFGLTVTATSTETNGGATATTTGTINVTVLPEETTTLYVKILQDTWQGGSDIPHFDNFKIIVDGATYTLGTSPELTVVSSYLYNQSGDDFTLGTGSGSGSTDRYVVFAIEGVPESADLTSVQIKFDYSIPVPQGDDKHDGIKFFVGTSASADTPLYNGDADPAFTGTSANLISSPRELSFDYSFSGDALTIANQLLTFAADPIVLDLGSGGIAFSSVMDGVHFDINADGLLDQVAWTSGDDGILAYDIDGSGKIENGSELFTPHFAGGSYADGLAALASLDSNHDGVINGSDAAYDKLVVWQDANHDGVSDAGEMRSLTQLGIASINLGASLTEASIDGQAIVAVGSLTYTDGSNGSFVEVNFDAALGHAPANDDAYDAALDAERETDSRNINAAALAASISFGVANAAASAVAADPLHLDDASAVPSDGSGTIGAASALPEAGPDSDAPVIDPLHGTPGDDTTHDTTGNTASEVPDAQSLAPVDSDAPPPPIESLTADQVQNDVPPAAIITPDGQPAHPDAAATGDGQHAPSSGAAFEESKAEPLPEVKSLVDNNAPPVTTHGVPVSAPVVGLAEQLTALDTNHDGLVDANDANFSQLTVWHDANHDGVADADELSSLADHGINGISANGVSIEGYLDAQTLLAQTAAGEPLVAVPGSDAQFAKLASLDIGDLLIGGERYIDLDQALKESPLTNSQSEGASASGPAASEAQPGVSSSEAAQQQADAPAPSVDPGGAQGSSNTPAQQTPSQSQAANANDGPAEAAGPNHADAAAVTIHVDDGAEQAQNHAVA